MSLRLSNAVPVEAPVTGVIGHGIVASGVGIAPNAAKRVASKVMEGPFYTTGSYVNEFGAGAGIVNKKVAGAAVCSKAGIIEGAASIPAVAPAAHCVRKCLSPTVRRSYVTKGPVETKQFVEPLGVSYPVRKSVIRKSYVQHKPAKIVEDVYDVPKTHFESVIKAVPQTYIKTIVKKIPVTRWINVEEKFPVTDIHRVVQRRVAEPAKKRVITENIPITEVGAPKYHYGIRNEYKQTNVVHTINETAYTDFGSDYGYASGYGCESGYAYAGKPSVGVSGEVACPTVEVAAGAVACPAVGVAHKAVACPAAVGVAHKAVACPAAVGVAHSAAVGIAHPAVGVAHSAVGLACSGCEVACPGVEVACPGVEVACPGVEVACPGIEVAEPVAFM